MNTTVNPRDIATLPSQDYPITAGAERGMLATKDRPEMQDDVALWTNAIDTLLDWLKRPEEADVECVKIAIEFAQKQREDGISAPSSMIATEDGEITLEWRRSQSLTMVTLQGSGRGEVTELLRGKVVGRDMIRFDPHTREFRLM